MHPAHFPTYVRHEHYEYSWKNKGKQFCGVVRDVYHCEHPTMLVRVGWLVSSVVLFNSTFGKRCEKDIAVYDNAAVCTAVVPLGM